MIWDLVYKIADMVKMSICPVSSGTDDGYVYLHDPRAPDPYVTQFRHHSYVIASLQPSPDSRLLACGVRDLGEVLIWDLRERKIFEQLSTHKSGNRVCIFILTLKEKTTPEQASVFLVTPDFKKNNKAELFILI